MKLSATKIVTAVILFAATLTQNVFAELSSEPSFGDERVKRIIYSPDEVYKINTHYLIQTHVVLEKGERILYIGAGQPTAWDIDHARNHIFIKPRARQANTNIKVITSSRDGKDRTYNFVATANEPSNLNAKDVTFEVQFVYAAQFDGRELRYAEALDAASNTQPEAPNRLKQEVVKSSVAQVSVENLNFNYTMSGDRDFAPVRAFDDGEFTYFQFRESVPLPAILAVDASGKTILVNYYPEGPYIKIHRTASQFVLLYDDVKVCVWNEAWQESLEATTISVR